jgi:glycosyltransferase involved in cell wall biosynthesis
MDIATAPYPAGPDSYFSPLKLFEYMAAGRAVVASRTGQATGVVEHGRTGWLCEPGDPAALADALATLAADPVLRRRLGAAARQAVCRAHTWDHVAVRILELAARAPAPVAAEAAP